MRRVISALTVVCLATSVFGVEHLVLIGGGSIPQQAVDRFSEWSGGNAGRVLTIDWAGGEGPDGPRKRKMGKGAAEEMTAPLASQLPTKKAEFLAQLGRATAVFFTGGQQHRVMDVLVKYPDLLEALRKRYAEGVTFGGTSAGTAIMSRTMITGDGEIDVIRKGAMTTREGLGLLPDVILDQHFIKRQRQNRVFSVLLDSRETLALGIDQGNAISVEGNRFAEVVGPGQVMVFDSRAQEGKVTIELLTAGMHYDLLLRKSAPADRLK